MIVLDRVSKSFDSGKYAVLDVSLEVSRGQMLVLLAAPAAEKPLP